VNSIKYRPLRSTQKMEFFFERPIFDWTGVMPKFFSMIFTAVGAKIPVNSKEFSALLSTNVGEVQGRYNIYGGASSISIFADRLSADFPVLTPTDYPLVRDLLKMIHDSFASEFPDCPISRAVSSSMDHIEILPPATVKEFLGRHRLPSLDEAFRAEAITEPAFKFGVKGTTQAWEYAVTAEQSLFHAAALFVTNVLKLNDVTKLPTFEDKVALSMHIEELTLKALGLERVDVIGS
jgi:hypothetical protein